MAWRRTVVLISIACIALLLLQSASILLGTDRSASASRHRTHFTLGICSSVKDDARWLVEWIEFHRMVGVEKFFIIDDGSTDATARILRHYELLGVVAVVPGSVPKGDERCAYPNARDSAYVARCYDHAAPHLDWMVIMDSDEYLYPRTGCSVRDYVTRECSAQSSHVVLYWEMFGSSGFRLHPHGMLTENFLSSGGDCSAYTDQWGPTCLPFAGNCKECRHTKYIANTKSCLQNAAHCNNHLPARLALAPATCNTNPDSVEHCGDWWQAQKGSRPLQYTPECCSAGLALHHYAPKSEEARRWRAKRRMRNGLSEDQDASPGPEKRDLNWVFSTGILKFIPHLRQRVRKQAAVLDLVDDTHVPVSPDVTFDTSSKCFFERGFHYAKRSHLPTAVEVARFCADETECCNLCATFSTRNTSRGGCMAFSFKPSHMRCTMFGYQSPEAELSTWPPRSLPLTRRREDGYISGVPVPESLCT
eukprot:TRINITY_DN7165_c1_g1_i1.p1 TRINITY_DN7165_c1_g1~~TRINITY_DN7165_c1_g1_i1.p1  ORF type:complete len:503 (+),score=44.41 TRINITY_DN7165_c1_g1_i1:81-1511(+)